jgi:hypothetical protein
MPSFAQKVQFTNSSNVWLWVDSTIGCCIPYPISYSSANYDSTPVVYNGHNYLYLISTTASFLVREEAGRVYEIASEDSVERLLYDFNLGIGDTIRNIYPEDTFVAWVATIDSTHFGGEWYKVWHFNGKDYSTYYPDSVRPFFYNVIEGLGCTNGLYYPASPYSLSAFSQQLLCFNNDQHISTALSTPVTCYGYTYTSDYDNYFSCSQFYSHHPVNHVGVKQLSQKEGKATVVPNPVNEASRIIFPNSISSGHVMILNQLGQVILNIPIEDKTEVVIGDKIKVPGVYYYRVTDAISGESFSGKFLNQ